MWISEHRFFAAGQTQGACPIYTLGCPGVWRGIFGCQGSIAASTRGNRARKDAKSQRKTQISFTPLPGRNAISLRPGGWRD
jgi:hypothetical protein